MNSIAIIGAGISGLTVAQGLKTKYDVTVFEKERKPGGLLRCNRTPEGLFYTCGGHVLNSKRRDVLDWLWKFFDVESEFFHKDRNAVVFLDNSDYESYKVIPYPIENNVYQIDEETKQKFLEELDTLDAHTDDIQNFGDYLKGHFGEILYNLYFRPYNEKIWKMPLSEIPLSLMEGKLPMPSVKEMKSHNINHTTEHSFVHSSFWVEKKGGPQFLIDRLTNGINIVYNSEIKSLICEDRKWEVNGKPFDKVVFCGNLKDMINMIQGVSLDEWKPTVNSLKYHGTTSVFCEIDDNPYTWIYLPSKKYDSHRIVCTGNFADSNDNNMLQKGRTTATIEFTGNKQKREILRTLAEMPLHPKYICHNYTNCSYPILSKEEKNEINNLKAYLEVKNLFFTGRFANWDYYNMDIAIGKAFDLCNKL